MSATNRGAVREPSDFYPTPLEAFNPLIPCLPWNVEIWEPACGDRRLVLAMQAAGLSADGADLSSGYDFLKDTQSRDCIVTNPPFSLAFEFAQHAVASAFEVFLLLRLGFLGSQDRSEWLKAHEPAALFVLSKRPHFVQTVKCGCGYRATFPVEVEAPKLCPQCLGKPKRGSSDASEYAWFYWGLRHSGISHL